MVRLSPAVAELSKGILTETLFKDIYLSYFFRGWPRQRFEQYGRAYAANVLPKIVKPDAAKKIQWHKDQEHKTIVVTASVREWIQPWCESMGLELISSEMEYHNDMVTGRLVSANLPGKTAIP